MLALILSLVGLGGAGAAAVAFPPFAALLLGLGRSALAFLAKIPWWAYAAVALLGLIAFLYFGRAHALERAQRAEAQGALVCQAVRDAAGRPRQDCRLGPLQIRALGKSVRDLEGALADQSKRIQALGRQSAALQAQAIEARRQAAQRSDQARGVAERIDASSRIPAAQPCPVSKALEEQWK